MIVQVDTFRKFNKVRKISDKVKAIFHYDSSNRPGY